MHYNLVDVRCWHILLNVIRGLNLNKNANQVHLDSTTRCHFTGLKKVSISRAQPPPIGPRNGFARIKSITYGAV